MTPFSGSSNSSAVGKAVRKCGQNGKMGKPATSGHCTRSYAPQLVHTTLDRTYNTITEKTAISYNAKCRYRLRRKRTEKACETAATAPLQCIKRTLLPHQHTLFTHAHTRSGTISRHAASTAAAQAPARDAGRNTSLMGSHTIFTLNNRTHAKQCVHILHYNDLAFAAFHQQLACVGH